jgi:hypothetical protein
MASLPSGVLHDYECVAKKEMDWQNQERGGKKPSYRRSIDKDDADAKKGISPPIGPTPKQYP